jgi:hypothetical protein
MTINGPLHPVVVLISTGVPETSSTVPARKTHLRPLAERLKEAGEDSGLGLMNPKNNHSLMRTGIKFYSSFFAVGAPQHREASRKSAAHVKLGSSIRKEGRVSQTSKQRSILSPRNLGCLYIPKRPTPASGASFPLETCLAAHHHIGSDLPASGHSNASAAHTVTAPEFVSFLQSFFLKCACHLLLS